jgi:hypothetical protein
MGNSNKFNIVAFRIKPEHKNEIMEYAEIEGLGMSAWVRRIVLNEIMRKRSEYANQAIKITNK